MSKTSVDFLAWSNTIEIFRQDARKCLPHSQVVLASVVIPKLPNDSRLKKPWHWEEVHQKAFDDLKATIARDVTLAYPDYSQGFKIYTDGSKIQLGAIITQNNRPIAFFSRKLSACQQNTE